jgi:chorismate mutase
VTETVAAAGAAQQPARPEPPVRTGPPVPTGQGETEQPGHPDQRGQPDTETLIAERRRRIDDLDARIIALVGERVAVSGEIQAARIGAGGRRLHLNREMEVLRTYGQALGRPGTALGMTLLELCRGRV